MASFTLNWTPAGGLNSLSQQIEYKPATSDTWTTATAVSAPVSTYTLNTLEDNVIYDFRIVNICAVGGPIPGIQLQSIRMVCPVITVMAIYNEVSFSFPHLGGSVEEYKAELLNGAGTVVIATKNITTPGTTVADLFSGLAPVTAYNLRITPKAGGFTKVCPLIPFSTPSVPTCDLPLNLTVTII